MNKHNAIIVDLDGTLADVEHRVHHLREEKKDWKSFNEGMVHDTLNEWCFELIHAMEMRSYKIILLTGRGEEYREKTEKWLHANNISYEKLFMRPIKDFRKDNVIKKEIYQNSISPRYNTLFVVEDRHSVVEMWRELGLTCLQCDWGDF